MSLSMCGPSEGEGVSLLLFPTMNPDYRDPFYTIVKAFW